MFCIVGIDPGQQGAIAFYFPSAPHLVAVEDMPLAGDHVDAVTLADRISQMRPDMAVIENVHSMPKQGVASSFKFGRSFGVALGVISALNIPHHFVSPQKWKKHFGLTSDKELSRALALRMWPEKATDFRLKRHADRAEASLLARYGAEALTGHAA
jgi:hypothetical protein